LGPHVIQPLLTTWWWLHRRRVVSASYLRVWNSKRGCICTEWYSEYALQGVKWIRID